MLSNHIQTLPADPCQSDVAIPEDVLAFCQKHGILPDLRKAMRLAIEVYHPINPIAVRMQADPEQDNQWAVIDVPVAGEIDDVLHRDEEFTEQWVHNVPRDRRDQIRVLYHF